MQEIRSVAVLGAGAMGSRLAAQFANAGVAVLLLDVISPGEADRSAAARRGLEVAARSRPPAFFADSLRRLVTPGNFEDHLPAIRQTDWIVEAVVEDLTIKRELLGRVARYRRPGTIVSTNTSGLSLARLAEGFPEEFQRCFLGVHFFNPPRYLHLVEIIPGPRTDADLLDRVAEFCDRRLGKGPVRAKDTPNFIANRIGFFWACTVNRLMVENQLTIEEVDALTGPLIGLPRTASFRLMDLIGLDVWAAIVRNLHASVPGDSWRERFQVPEFVARMIEKGWLGDKVRRGFYVRGPEQTLVLDWKTLEYRAARTVRFPGLEAAWGIEDLPHRLRALASFDGPAGRFLWPLWRDVLLYAAERIPEISDRIVEIDRALRWGYAHRLGPFELWDALGVPQTVRRMQQEGCLIAESVRRMLASGATAFYRTTDCEGRPGREYFDLGATAYRPLGPRPGVLVLADLKRARGIVASNAGASLVDLGDGVLALEFHSPSHLLGEHQLVLLETALEQTACDRLALVIANQGEQFSGGLDAAWILRMVESGAWDQLNRLLARWQQACLAVKYARRPVVAAPFGQTLGLACELVLHAAARQAAAESYLGLDQLGAGLIPAAGGVKELLLRCVEAGRVLENVIFRRVSSSAVEARELGLLAGDDPVTMNRERLIGDAQALAMRLAAGYRPPSPPSGIPTVDGEAAVRLLEALRTASERGALDEYDGTIGEQLVRLWSGAGRESLSESDWLDLERETLLSLCGKPETRRRLERAARAAGVARR